MSKVKKMEPLKLISHLRGEVGGIIQSWVIFKIYEYKILELKTGNLLEDMENENLNLLKIVQTKFKEDIISRLSEISKTSHGRLNFNFAADKFKIQKEEVKKFSNYLKEKNIEFSRNKNISHKEISSSWEQIDPSPYIKNKVITKGVAWAMVIMKRFDKEYYGSEYNRFWQIERRKRYNLEMPGAPKYMLFPHIRR
ncbi:hypothetical protein [Polaribacter septentrionalilitoris]|uniref:hypothetical protein n=1 Tax=Polaribacter septentrionalilitoris TaxID=2494657 RepID=UPI00135B674A|nr:hypothetical protein [Polaribacter septentrionalilitoris]